MNPTFRSRMKLRRAAEGALLDHRLCADGCRLCLLAGAVLGALDIAEAFVSVDEHISPKGLIESMVEPRR